MSVESGSPKFASRDLAHKSETDRYIIVVAIIGLSSDPYSQNRNP